MYIKNKICDKIVKKKTHLFFQIKYLMVIILLWCLWFQKIGAKNSMYYFYQKINDNSEFIREFIQWSTGIWRRVFIFAQKRELLFILYSWKNPRKHPDILCIIIFKNKFQYQKNKNIPIFVKYVKKKIYLFTEYVKICPFVQISKNIFFCCIKCTQSILYTI